MKQSELIFAKNVLELVIKYGVSGFLQIIKTWNKDNPTIEEIEALKDRVPGPESYF